MISNNRFVVLVCILWLISGLGCDKNIKIIRDGFRLEYAINNPAHAFHVRLVFETNPRDSLIGLMYIARTAKESGILDYREGHTLRQATGDTLFMNPSQFSDLLECVNDLHKMIKPSNVYGQSDGKIVNINLRHSGKSYDWRLFGKTDQSSVKKLTAYIETMFEETYPGISLSAENSRIELSLCNHANSKNTETNFSIYSNNNIIRVHQDSLSAYTLDAGKHLYLWQVLEANDVWRLDDNKTMQGKYPSFYELKIQMGKRTHRWSAYAPIYLDDRRYLRIVQAIESTVLSR